MIFNITGGGGSLNKSVIIVSAPTGSVVTVSKDGITKSAAEKNGQWRFDGLDNGTWTIKATHGVQSAQTTQAISRFDVYYLSLSYFGATIQITYPAGSTVSVTDGTLTLKAPNTSGKWDCLVPNAGTWTVTSTLGDQRAEKAVSISSNGQTQSVTLKYFAAYINATWPAGSTCKATNGGTTLSAPNTSGSYTFTVPRAGTWIVSCSGSGMSDSKNVSISSDGQSASVALTYRATPDFSYSGSYQIVNDDDTPISDWANHRGNWKIRLLTSSVFQIKNLFGFNGKIDVFCVGGGANGGKGHYGANGGGGGYTKTTKNVSVSVNRYEVTIGGAGGATSAFGVSANGGSFNGGSGGGAGGTGDYYGWHKSGGAGGSDGGNGGQSLNANPNPADPGGKGQGTTTREFGEAGGKLYAGGGGGGAGVARDTWSWSSPGAGGSGGGGKGGEKDSATGKAGTANTGGGGGGGSVENAGGAGGSGIVVIRNARG